MFIKEFFHLNDRYTDRIMKMVPNFGYDGFGEAIYYRTYSRLKDDGGQENWNDTVLRSINGTLSIRKDHYLKNHIRWNEEKWQKYAYHFGKSMFNMEWMPPGRGLWAMGTPFIAERGSMALYNCGYTEINAKSFADDVCWLMDALMLGVGVGFEPKRDNVIAQNPTGQYIFIIQDNRESWIHSIKLLINAFLIAGNRLPIFNYDLIRPAGSLIRGFGGISSGPEPLKKLHGQIKDCFNKFINHEGYDVVRLKTDICNLVGCCVVAGNVRRSAEIALGEVNDPVFLNLKDYENYYPDRESHGWMSNNTVKLYEDPHYEQLGEIAKRVSLRGEPGVANIKNFKFGRIGKRDLLRNDKARGLNPCGEITLENKELCNVDETYPTVCKDNAAWYKACEYATFYASTVSLMMTHCPETNEVMSRNRRIGVGIVDYTGWVHRDGMHKVIKAMRVGYNIVTKSNQKWNSEAGVPEAIKKTTVKPGGTTPKLPGKTSGIGYPTFKETLRRFTVAKNNPTFVIFNEANIPYTELKHDKNSVTFEWPILQGPSKPAQFATLWEQAMNLITVQREWADNAVSNTLYYRPKWRLIKYYGYDVAFAEKLALMNDVKRINKGGTETHYKNSKSEFKAKTERYIVKHNNDGQPLELYYYVYDPEHEEDDIEPVLSMTVPVIKSLSLLPHTPKGAYENMPEEGISEEEYLSRKASIKPIDWSKLRGSDGMDEKYCSGPSCEIPNAASVSSN